MRHSDWLLGVFAVLLVLLPVTAVEGTQAPAKAAKPTRSLKPKREAAALAFAREHHRELVKLLARLKTSRPKEYGRAIDDLSKTNERLAKIKSRDAARYQRELKAWELKSRIQLLAARLQINPHDESLHAKLKKALIEQANLRKAHAVAERRRLADRLKKLDLQIRQMQTDSEKAAEKKLQSLIRHAKKGTGRKKRKSQGGGKPN